MTNSPGSNIAIFPASLLPFATELRAFGESLPTGTCLIVPPKRPGPTWDALIGFAYHALDRHGRAAEVAEIDSSVLAREVIYNKRARAKP